MSKKYDLKVSHTSTVLATINNWSFRFGGTQRRRRGLLSREPISRLLWPGLKPRRSKITLERGRERKKKSLGVGKTGGVRDGKRKMARGASFISKREASADDTSRGQKKPSSPPEKGEEKWLRLRGEARRGEAHRLRPITIRC